MQLLMLLLLMMIVRMHVCVMCCILAILVLLFYFSGVNPVQTAPPRVNFWELFDKHDLIFMEFIYFTLFIKFAQKHIRTKQ